MKALLVAACLCVGSKAFAALPPLYQGKKEIQAILADPQFSQSLSSGDLIEDIKRTSDGYLIITNHRILPVLVHYQPSDTIGPVQFTLEFKTPVDLVDQTSQTNY